MTEKDFIDGNLKDGSDVTFLVFRASWCGQCKVLLPVLEALSKEHGFSVFSFDVDDEPELADEFSISTVPSLFIYKGKERVRNIRGSRSKSELERILGEI